MRKKKVWINIWITAKFDFDERWNKNWKTNGTNSRTPHTKLLKLLERCRFRMTHGPSRQDLVCIGLVPSPENKKKKTESIETFLLLVVTSLNFFDESFSFFETWRVWIFFTIGVGCKRRELLEIRFGRVCAIIAPGISREACNSSVFHRGLVSRLGRTHPCFLRFSFVQ